LSLLLGSGWPLSTFHSLLSEGYERSLRSLDDRPCSVPGSPGRVLVSPRGQLQLLVVDTRDVFSPPNNPAGWFHCNGFRFTDGETEAQQARRWPSVPVAWLQGCVLPPSE
jgi:hypothetical protein